MAVVKFPSNKDIEDMSDAVEQEVDELFDYMDSRIEEGADGTALLIAMTMVLKMITESENMTESVH